MDDMNQNLHEKYADYNAAELVFGRDVAKAFKQLIDTAAFIEKGDDVVARIPDYREKPFYDGLAAGLLFSCIAVKQAASTKQSIYGVFAVLSFVLLALTDHTDSPGLDLLSGEEINALLKRVPDGMAGYDSAVQEVLQVVEQEIKHDKSK